LQLRGQRHRGVEVRLGFLRPHRLDAIGDGRDGVRERWIVDHRHVGKRVRPALHRVEHRALEGTDARSRLHFGEGWRSAMPALRG
jgi:hypothetical protein